jgi:hypothetical protein
MSPLPDLNTPNQRLVISYMTLRRAVGILGMALPLVLLLGNLILSKDCQRVQFSISDYFYTRMGPVFVGTLCAVGLFLFSYNGYTKGDKYASLLGSICAFTVALNPTNTSDLANPCNIQHRTSLPYVNFIHFGSATILFLTFAYFSLCLFTKTSGDPTPEKIMRNKIYRTCGWIMIGAIICIIIVAMVNPVQQALKAYNPILIFEWILLWAFGFSWLVKGEAILKDK